ncbi:hypothetical protein BGZ63DRAFT_423265 [Mariannaea sp. PMI_226]|nr:hypothetical protein BGZ63DRAFT_423265 [Mariannaea sp. PMI_226]
MISATDSLSLAGKIAIITGSGKENGIGAGIARKLAQAGARVVINYVSDFTGPRASKLAIQIESEVGKDNVLVIKADVSTVDGAKLLVEQTLKGFEVDHIDILVNNAAMGGFGSVLTTAPEELVNMFNVNVFSAIYMIQAVVPWMPAGGRIINIGSVASKLGLVGLPVYGATKAAVGALTFSMSHELGHEKGITINTIAPGPVETDSFPSEGPPPVQQLKNYLVSMTRAEDRPGTTDDIADTALFLASEKSRWITGQWISVSGGITGM